METWTRAFGPVLRLLAAVCALLLVATEQVSAQEFPRIGAVELVQVLAYGTTVGGTRRDLSVEDPVFGEELVETARGGALHLRFADDTFLQLGSDSRAVLDEFVFDPERGTGEIALSLTKGFFRYISGKLKGEAVAIRTPTLVISVRGTVITIVVLLNGGSFVSVQDGLGIVTSLADRSSMELTPETPPVQVLPGGPVMPYGGRAGPPSEGLESDEVLDALMGVSPELPLPPMPGDLTIPGPILPDIQTVSPKVPPTVEPPAGEPPAAAGSAPTHKSPNP